MPKQAVVRTPLELELEKVKWGPGVGRGVEAEYQLLRLLNEVSLHHPSIVSTPIFARLLDCLLSSENSQHMQRLPLYEVFSHRLWNNEQYSFEVREKTPFYGIVSNWIVSFELKSGNLAKLANQFELIKVFMVQHTHTPLQRIVLIQETFEDLKELISPHFWQPPSAHPSAPAKLDEEALETAFKVFEVVEAITRPLFLRIGEGGLHRNCIYAGLAFPQAAAFTRQCILFLLSQPGLPTYLQTEVTKCALIHLQSLPGEERQGILGVVTELMVRTSKAVRLALVVEYVEFYEFLEAMGWEDVIEELENLVYFREVIIGRRMVEQSLEAVGNTLNQLNLSYQSLYVKAGTTHAVYFATESPLTVLTLDLILEEHDINLAITHLDRLPLPPADPTNPNTLIFRTIAELNAEQEAPSHPYKPYWREERSSSKKLELKLQYPGLYSLEFDNRYSWVIPKKPKFRLELYQPFPQ